MLIKRGQRYSRIALANNKEGLEKFKFLKFELKNY